MDKKTKQFLSIIEHHKRLIYKVVNAYCKNRALHDDLSQEVIIQLWSSFQNYDNKFKHSTWIYRIALNTAISFYRKGQNESKYNYEFLPQHENLLIVENISVEDPNLKLLHQFIQDLKEIDKALILLYLDGYNHIDISNIVGISVTNVGTKIARIKKQLQKNFINHTNQTL